MLVLRLEDGVLRAATCGFWGGETKEYPTCRIDLPVRGFFRLRKGPLNLVRPVPAAQAALEVVCGIPSMKRPLSDHRFLLEFAGAAAQAVPMHELQFHNRDDSFWSVVDELQGEGQKS